MQVLKRSQYLLLQMASPDALVRLEQSPLADQKEELLELYFKRQHHNSLEDFLAHHLQRNGTRGENLLMQVGWGRGVHLRRMGEREVGVVAALLFYEVIHNLLIATFTATIQVTTHSHLLSRDELDHVSSTLSLDQSHIHVFSLQEFDTELDFSNKVR